MMRARALGVSLAIVAGLLGSSAYARTVCEPESVVPGGEWRRMGYDLGHTRHQAAENKLGKLQAASLEPVWTFSANEATGEFPSEITGYPIVADGCVFVGTNSGRGQPGWIFALNADGGDVSWKHKVSDGVYSTLAVEDGIVYVFVSKIGAPYLLALDAVTGGELWRTTVDAQEGSDAVSSPIVYDGMVWVGVSGTAAEGEEESRFDFRGASVLVAAGRACHDAEFVEPETGAVLTTECAGADVGDAGRILAHTFAIPFAAWDNGEGDAGGAIWSTISIDPEARVGYVGTGNPFNYDDEHANTNAVVKIDLDRASGTFGTIVASYKGDVEEYFPEISENYSCDENDPVGFFLAGFECGRLDLDFGAAPNLFRDRSGTLRVGAGQKSGVYHAIDPTSMDPVWKRIMGVPSLVGGIVGTPAFDGTAIYAPHTIGGYLASLNRDTGAPKWVAPVGDGVHWGSPVTSANGVLYTVDLKGFLDAYDASTGAPLLHRPMALGSRTGTDPTLSWGGATVARRTVYASVGVGLTSAGASFPAMPDGFVIAYRPSIR